MEWVRVDEALIAEGFNPTEQKAISQGRAIGEAADPVPGICSGVASRVRAAVLAGGRLAHMAPDALSIPNALRGEATAILRVRLLTRFALSITEERKREAEAAEARLDSIAKGEIPLADDAVQQTPTYHGRPHRWKNPEAGGIMPIRSAPPHRLS